MRNFFTKDNNASLSIAAGQALSIEARAAKSLQVTSGRVWVTVTGQSDGEPVNISTSPLVAIL